MANDRADEFLDLYKQMEQLLKAKYADDGTRYESVVYRFENSRESDGMKDEVAAIREIRNLLQHNPKVGGSYIIDPSEDIMEALRRIIASLEHPRMAIDYGVKANQIYSASLSSGLIKVLNVMKERGFSHVPIIENRKLYGVLSAYVIFEFITEQGMQIITDQTKVGAIRDYLPITKHKQEYYIFMSRKATFFDADEAFEKRDKRGRRLVAIFITENGREDEAILAMLTPWSVVGK